MLTPLVLALLAAAVAVLGFKLLLILGRAVTGTEASPRCGRPMRAAGGAWMPGMCASGDCRHLNPLHAHYCGRCGRELAQRHAGARQE